MGVGGEERSKVLTCSFLKWCSAGSIRHSLLICSQSSKEENELMSRFNTRHSPYTCALGLAG